MPEQLQTRSNHARIDPSFHYFLLPLSLLLFVWTIVRFVRHPGANSALLAVAIFLIAFTALKARQYAMKVQDRVIRLEERLRLSEVLPEPLRSRIREISESQLIALRFASDGELPQLTERVLNEKLSNKQIKDAIQNWRGDYWRV